MTPRCGLVQWKVRMVFVVRRVVFWVHAEAGPRDDRRCRHDNRVRASGSEPGWAWRRGGCGRRGQGGPRWQLGNRRHGWRRCCRQRWRGRRRRCRQRRRGRRRCCRHERRRWRHRCDRRRLRHVHVDLGRDREPMYASDPRNGGDGGLWNTELDQWAVHLRQRGLPQSVGRIRLCVDGLRVGRRSRFRRQPTDRGLRLDRRLQPPPRRRRSDDLLRDRDLAGSDHGSVHRMRRPDSDLQVVHDLGGDDDSHPADERHSAALRLNGEAALPQGIVGALEPPRYEPWKRALGGTQAVTSTLYLGQ